MWARELWVTGAMKRLSLKRRELKRHDEIPSTCSSRPSLLQLPYEPLLEVLMNLEVEEILSMRLVRCRLV